MDKVSGASSGVPEWGRGERKSERLSDVPQLGEESMDSLPVPHLSSPCLGLGGMGTLREEWNELQESQMP